MKLRNVLLAGIVFFAIIGFVCMAVAAEEKKAPAEEKKTDSPGQVVKAFYAACEKCDGKAAVGYLTEAGIKKLWAEVKKNTEALKKLGFTDEEIAGPEKAGLEKFITKSFEMIKGILAAQKEELKIVVDISEEKSKDDNATVIYSYYLKSQKDSVKKETATLTKINGEWKISDMNEVEEKSEKKEEGGKEEGGEEEGGDGE